jgi:hypothetical protein
VLAMHGVRAGASRAPPFGTETVMPRLGFVLIATAATISYALAGCSALMFDRSERRPSAPSPQTLQFQSEPIGADVRTGQGETCQTPCSLALPVESQSVTICKERLPVADGSDHRRSAAARAFLFLGQTATDFDTESGERGAPNGSATARPASSAVCAASTAAHSASTAACQRFAVVSELIAEPVL